jgi:hypothetical protein
MRPDSLAAVSRQEHVDLGLIATRRVLAGNKPLALRVARSAQWA